MRLLALLPFAMLLIVGGCDDSNPTDALDAKTQEKKEIVEQSSQDEDPASPAAKMKTTKELVRESFGEDDPTTFIVEEPADLLFGSALRKKTKWELARMNDDLG